MKSLRFIKYKIFKFKIEFLIKYFFNLLKTLLVPKLDIVVFTTYRIKDYILFF